MKLAIGYLYPDLFNLYGDRGNVQCLQKRLKWRGIGAEVVHLNEGDEVDFTKLDLIVWGGRLRQGAGAGGRVPGKNAPGFRSLCGGRGRGAGGVRRLSASGELLQD